MSNVQSKKSLKSTAWWDLKLGCWHCSCQNDRPRDEVSVYGARGPPLRALAAVTGEGKRYAVTGRRSCRLGVSHGSAWGQVAAAGGLGISSCRLLQSQPLPPGNQDPGVMLRAPRGDPPCALCVGSRCPPERGCPV